MSKGCWLGIIPIKIAAAAFRRCGLIEKGKKKKREDGGKGGKGKNIFSPSPSPFLYLYTFITPASCG